MRDARAFRSQDVRGGARSRLGTIKSRAPR